MLPTLPSIVPPPPRPSTPSPCLSRPAAPVSVGPEQQPAVWAPASELDRHAAPALPLPQQQQVSHALTYWLITSEALRINLCRVCNWFPHLSSPSSSSSRFTTTGAHRPYSIHSPCLHARTPCVPVLDCLCTNLILSLCTPPQPSLPPCSLTGVLPFEWASLQLLLADLIFPC